MRSIRHRRRNTGTAVLAIMLCFATAGHGQQEETLEERSIIYTRDRRKIPCYIERSDNSSIYWSLEKETEQSVQMPLSSIVSIHFPPPKRWEDAVDAYYGEDYRRAAQLFKHIAQSEQHVVTAPGNYATQATFWQLNALQNLGQLQQLATEIEGFDASLLPPGRRLEGEILYAWAEIAHSQWEEASKRLQELSQRTDDVTLRTEIWFLRGLVLTKEGRREEALHEFTRAYTIGYGTGDLVQKIALRRSIELLADLGREKENTGLIKIYRANYGQGELWDGADVDRLLPPAPKEAVQGPVN